MKTLPRFARVASVALLLTGLALASSSADPTPSPTPSASAAAGSTEFDASDIKGLTPLVDQQVTVTGTIFSQDQSKNGNVLFLHFSKDWNQSITLVFFVKDGAPTHDQLLNYVGKKVRVAGKLIEYQKKLEFKLESPSVIEILP